MTVLATGATGHTGQHVVARLAADGAPVRALTRKPSTAALPGAVDVHVGDLTRPETVASALGRGSAAPVPRSKTATQIVEPARRSGVQRVVVLSCGSAARGFVSV